MVCLRPCSACRHGDHATHVKNYAPAPEGMLGGFACTCEGECVDGRYCPPQFTNTLRAIQEAFAASQEGQS